MNTTFWDKLKAFIKANPIVAAGLGIVLLFVFFGKTMRRIFPRKRVRHRKTATSSTSRKKRSMPRSVGMHKVNKGAKKPWQIKGSEAARRHMAKIRRMR